MHSHFKNGRQKLHHCTSQADVNADSLCVLFKGPQNILDMICTSAVAFPSGTVIWIAYS